MNALKMRERIFSAKESRTCLLSFKNPCAIFVTLCKDEYEEEHDDLQDVCGTFCSSGHDLLRFAEDIFSKFCAIFMENYVSKINDLAHSQRKRYPQGDPSGSKKIKKLQSVN